MLRKQPSWAELGALKGTSSAQIVKVKQLHARGKKKKKLSFVQPAAVLCGGCIVLQNSSKINLTSAQLHVRSWPPRCPLLLS